MEDTKATNNANRKTVEECKEQGREKHESWVD